jgi:uncharacterized membrane protein YsdA (DUF1294 family)
MRRKSTVSILFVAAFFVGLGISVVAGGLSSLIFSVYLALSVMTFAVYAVDKSAAKNGDYRVSEALLQYLSLAGGWPGALIAQQVLRHKSKKVTFRRVFWVSVILNCALLVWLHTPAARSIFRRVDNAPIALNLDQALFASNDSRHQTVATSENHPDLKIDGLRRA